MLSHVIIYTLALELTCAQKFVKILLLTEENQAHVVDMVAAGLQAAEQGHEGSRFDQVPVAVDRENEDESFQQVCRELAGGVSAVLDLTWTGWGKVRTAAASAALPYFRADVTPGVFVDAVDAYLGGRQATDAALIFQNEEELDQTLYYMIGRSIIRVIVLDGLEGNNTDRLLAMRPSPSYFVVYATSANLTKLYSKAVAGNLVTREERWLLVFTDFRHQEFDRASLQLSAVLFTLKTDVCCRLAGEPAGCRCDGNTRVLPSYLRHVVQFLGALASHLEQRGLDLAPRPVADCAEHAASKAEPDLSFYSNVTQVMAALGDDRAVGYDPADALLYLRAGLDVSLESSTSRQPQAEFLGRERGLVLAPNVTLRPGRRFFRVGTAESIPWSYVLRDEATGEPLLDEKGHPLWDGYCVELLRDLADNLQFDYEIVPPKDGSFGNRRADGSWTGMVGDLATGETDIIIAPLTMTSEREEVIDFVAPYFDQSGISIVIRKPVRKTSLFKFMTVLRLEVWLSIVGALTVTGVMIWFLDKYSPYSAQNNKAMYPYPCREFTLKESFWFALTSFTPQGGGEAPKALSARTLVAAYWLFVVLMLATFTANLAAFLTVERMKSPVASLEQLAKQSRINYTVVKDSDTHEYFKNMKNAEDVLYNVWKDITLNSTSDQSKYRVWDYPIKEQYGHILQAITQAGPVENASVGFQKVIAEEDGKFAFIHDAAQIRYEVSRNCNLTEVGEMFAEQPYAIAVQQGSHLQLEISRRILDLQKDRYFETLSGKYWNSSVKGTCPDTDDSEGITLESLGGVFIATLFGLALAMVTLAGEIFYYKRKRTTAVSAQKPGGQPLHDPSARKLVTLAKDFRPVGVGGDKAMPRVSYISVFPRGQLY
ncbi:ionotropic receptor 25a-like [Bacillus rossius redtenbacheri]|uniref:ionotropic receptor 25a-like n=1 Tax=Bacillus rossius redtenbacheri TaxID=93214 RepID=UPI002FDD1050